ncbi:MAG TPA: IS1595 family transposase [Rhizobiaceae bacterium]|nr:IS1595 family transposase [Rhizobiaceae bacterium]
MAQHFLLSSAAKTLTIAKVARLSDEEARETFRHIRWAATGGKPVCPHCSCGDCYTFTKRLIYKCKACEKQFSLTSGTIFASRKLAVRDYLLAIAIFVNGAKGYAALQLSRDLGVQYRTAYVMAHKIREALAAERTADKLGGHVEVDGGYFGGYVKPANYKVDRVDRRRLENQTGKRRVVVVMRERNGRTLPFVFKTEAQGVAAIFANVRSDAIVYADEATHWDALHTRFLTKRINHQEAYSDGEACTNQAESFFSRLRRAEIGTHHRISGKYLHAYASEMAWREDNRRMSNGEQYLTVINAALAHPKSSVWAGYWNRKAK